MISVHEKITKIMSPLMSTEIQQLTQLEKHLFTKTTLNNTALQLITWRVLTYWSRGKSLLIHSHVVAGKVPFITLPPQKCSSKGQIFAIGRM